MVLRIVVVQLDSEERKVWWQKKRDSFLVGYYIYREQLCIQAENFFLAKYCQKLQLELVLSSQQRAQGSKCYEDEAI